ncbi:MAG: ribonuclease III, partial [Myxococcota bacterium]
MSEIDTPTAVDALMDAVSYEFDDLGYLREALTHASYRNEHQSASDNERLEFLGDSILGAVVAHLLTELFPQHDEGHLTRYKAVLVSELGLVETARSIDLGRYLLLGRGESLSGGREKASVLANAMEALIAAIYLDGGFEAAFGVIERLYEDRLTRVGNKERRVDFKTKLQERAQSRFHQLPRYEILSWSGPDHAREYEA